MEEFNKEKYIKNMFFSSAETFMDKIGEAVDKLYKDSNGMINLPNIGITYNNCLVKMASLYREKGLSFYSSNLKFIIRGYLVSIVAKSIDILNEYIEFIKKEYNGLVNSENAKEKNLEASKILDKYRKLDDEIFNFSIEKDIIKAFDYDVELWEKIALEGGYNLYAGNDGQNAIKAYNEELKTLGCEIQIPYVESNVMSEDNSYATIKQRSEPIEGEPLKQLKDIFSQKYLETAEKLKKQKLYYVSNAIGEQLMNLMEKAVASYHSENMEEYHAFFERIQNFDISLELTESVGKFLAYWNDIQGFHGINLIDIMGHELQKMGYSNIMSIVMNDINNNKYVQYLEERNNALDAHINQIDNVISQSR